MVWRKRICVSVTNYVDQQTLKPDDDYVLRLQRLWMFDILVCPLSVTERFLLQPLVCETVFHCTSLLSPLSPSSAVVLNHISSHCLIPLSDSSLICTVTRHFGVYNHTYNILTFTYLYCRCSDGQAADSSSVRWCRRWDCWRTSESANWPDWPRQWWPVVSTTEHVLQDNQS